MTVKSPFYVVEEFISPLLCEDIIHRLNNTLPDYDTNGKPLKTIRTNKLSEIRLLPEIRNIIPALEEYYGFEYLGLHPMNFEWFPTGFKELPAHCENSNLIDGNKRWSRTNDKDFTGIIFLNDYRDKPPFDPDFEVVGGKLSFPTHQFGFIPKRGQLVVFPGTPHFINATEKVILGDLNQIRFWIAAEDDYEYDPKKFPGSYKEWFK